MLVIIYTYKNIMDEEAKFETIYLNLANLSNFNNDEVFYIKKIEPNYKIKIPTKLIGQQIPILTYKKSSTENDMYQFTISRFYSREDETRTHVVLYCNDILTGEITRFECYASKSDGSFWRFCVKDDNEDRYDKGYNYITTTFINIYLQRFIDSHKSLFEIPKDTKPLISCEKTKELNNYLKRRISGSDYSDSNMFFKALNAFFQPVEYINNFKKCVADLLEYLAKNINQNTLSEFVQIASDIFCHLNKYNVNKSVEMSNIRSRRNFFNNVRMALDDLFLKYFTVNRRTKTKIYDKPFMVGVTKFMGTIYSVEIIYRANNAKYILYYMEYYSIEFIEIEGIGTNKNIIYIKPIPKGFFISNHINQYGLDERYVSGGPFINKIFDYQHQAPISVLRGHIERLTDGYRYIGDLTNYSFLP